jgi:hypothetical protein
MRSTFRAYGRLAPAAFGLLLLASACTGDGSEASSAPDARAGDRSAYLTLLGEDTLVAEWFEFDGNSVTATAMIRGTRTNWSEYRLETDDAGLVTTWEARSWSGPPEGEPARIEFVEQTDSGAMLVTEVPAQGEEGRRMRPFDAEPGAVPFVDFLHWPFEFAFRAQAEGGRLGEGVPILGGRVFEVEPNDDGSWTLIHPSRGPSTVEIAEDGRILALDGTGSTRAYDLRRMGWDDIDRATFRTAFADRPIGELSGRGEIAVSVAGVNFSGDYGTPQRRGREIFGRLVAYGERWRTGANRATHLSFDRDIVIDGVTVPAGDYTLYSIPEAEGGTLIINGRTGQTGTSYTEEDDVARIRMRREALDTDVEVFEIRIVENDSGDGGRIELRWAETVYFVPFTAG